MGTPSNAAAYLRPSIVRVKSREGDTVGAGFLAGDRTVITCAHVVEDAGGYALGGVPPAQSLTVEFVMPQPARDITAHVTGWSPPEDSDIAILELDEDPPAPAHRLDLTTTADGDLIQHRFYAFGFPAGSEGKWAQGRLLAQIANGWVQLQDDNVTGTRIQGGFSGTPVWDDDLHAVVGMIVAAEKDHTEKVGYLIPTQQLYRTLYGWTGQEAGSPRLEVTPGNIDFGSMGRPSRYLARIQVLNSPNEADWTYEVSGDPVEVRRVDNDAVAVQVSADASPFATLIRFRGTGGETSLKIAGGRWKDPGAKRFARGRRSRSSAVAGELPASNDVEALSVLRAWSLTRLGVPDDLFDGDLTVVNASLARLHVTWLHEQRTQKTVTKPSGKVGLPEYVGAIRAVSVPPAWSSQTWTGIQRGSSMIIPCVDCGAEGTLPCGECRCTGLVSCPKDIRCETCIGVGSYHSGGETRRCESCSGAGRKMCGDCNGSGQRACGSCKGSRRVQCTACEGTRNLVRFTEGMISQTATSSTSSFGYGPDATTRSVRESDYETLSPVPEAIRALPEPLRQALAGLAEAARLKSADLCQVQIDVCPVIAVAYRYAEHSGTAYVVGRDRRVRVPLTRNEHRYLRRATALSSSQIAAITIQAATDKVRARAGEAARTSRDKGEAAAEVLQEKAEALQERLGKALGSIRKWRGAKP
jgi:Trypsin-like peptidase domain